MSIGKLAGTNKVHGGVQWVGLCRLDPDEKFTSRSGTIFTSASRIVQPVGVGFPVKNPRIVIKAVVGSGNVGGGAEQVTMYTLAGNPLPFSGASVRVYALIWPNEDGPFHETSNLIPFPASVTAEVTGIIALGGSAQIQATQWHKPKTPLETSEQVSTEPTRMRQVKGFSNANNDIVYLMFFDTSNGAVEVTVGTEPLWTIKVPLGATFSDDFIESARIFQYGLYWALSSTPDTFTAYLAAGFRVDIEIFGQQVPS